MSHICSDDCRQFLSSAYFYYSKTSILKSAVELASSLETLRRSPFFKGHRRSMCPQSMRCQLTPTRAQASNMWRLAAGLVGLPGRREMPERGQFCGDCSQACTARLG
jgi:hypothetical protein